MRLSDKIKQQYRSAVSNAKNRGLEFWFTREEWIFWWLDNLGSNWFELRGTNPDQYVMARRGDTGPYAHWNVECITQRQNLLDAQVNGQMKKPKKPHLTKDKVQEIFISDLPQRQLAKKYNVTVKAVSLIKRRETHAKHTTQLARGRYFNSFR